MEKRVKPGGDAIQDNATQSNDLAITLQLKLSALQEILRDLNKARDPSREILDLQFTI